MPRPGGPFSTADIGPGEKQNGDGLLMDKKRYTSRVACTGGMASLLLALWRVVGLLMCLNRQGAAYQYLRYNHYITEILAIFTVAYLALNATIGGMTIYLPVSQLHCSYWRACA